MIVLPASQRNTTMQLTKGEQLRTEGVARFLAEHLPNPPQSYIFTNRQKLVHIQFFERKKINFYLSYPEHMLICTILQLSSSVSVFWREKQRFFCFIFLVPDNCSEILCQLVLSLFITHADCDLNKTGRLVDEEIYREYPFRGFWYSHLERRPL